MNWNLLIIAIVIILLIIVIMHVITMYTPPTSLPRGKPLLTSSGLVYAYTPQELHQLSQICFNPDSPAASMIVDYYENALNEKNDELNAAQSQIRQLELELASLTSLT